MVFRNPTEVFVADTLKIFLDQMCVSAQAVLEAIDDGLEESVIEQYNDKVAEQNRVDSLDEISEETIREELQSILGGHNQSLFRDYLDTLEEEYTIVQTPSGWEKIILLGGVSNELSKALKETLESDWMFEAEGDSVGRAYHPDPTVDGVNKEDIVSVEIQTDYEAPYAISTSAYNEQRGMGDLHDSTTAETLNQATSKAATLAEEVKGVNNQ